ncbi:T-complex protein 1 subunit gamma [Penicillium maclennaniae]|uniref:T-complex protein 1 subunit gamma n=1 Tax=Penicillium maclennaniae TaxID=1343394 RepID=UPI00253FB34E|nr:T-complex protein 1 subunit gamma [Penicillium maclennaniae]KAJ5684059.1 T-complex protein 1 subunit gamma [Penicillium maclennaniae]
MQAPVVVMNTNAGDRQVGRRAQLSNITAAKTVSDIIRSCLGPKAMLKMLLDPMGGIVLTNDGHAILREIEVSHPAAKSMIELSRTQDEEVGDGTTTPEYVLTRFKLVKCWPWPSPQLERNIHPVVIISAFKRALADALQIVEDVSLPVDIHDDKAMYTLIQSSIGTKFVSRWSDLMCGLALSAVRTVSFDVGGGKQEVDIKRYARIEKIPGGQIEDSEVIDGVMVNKDITHPKMRRRIENPRIMLLDCPLEYKKGESQTNIEVSKEDDWNRILQIEEEQVKHMCEAIVAFKPDVVITEKGVSDLAQHFLMKANITALRRVRKTDNNRIARATGATIVNRVDDIQESDIGTRCGLFEIEKIGDEYFTFMRQCKSPKACTILLRGPSKDILNEIERNLQDAMAVARNVIFHPRLSPGGGAVEMAVSVKLSQLARSVEGVQQWPYKAVADAMEVIPRTLAQNAGVSPIRVLTRLRAKHVEGYTTWGLDGESGNLVDMKEYGVWEPEAVKLQSIKTAVESACLLLRVDDICSGKSAQQAGGVGGGSDE